jgi:pimeloyl-ACP methyl ester carboxylesterase
MELRQRDDHSIMAKAHCDLQSNHQRYEIMKNASSQINKPAKLLAVAAVAFSVCGLVGTIHAADPVFDGAKSTWHDGFVRYDFLMDDENLTFSPFTRPEKEGFEVGAPAKGKRRCIVVVPTKPAPGHPWSWQGCYWNHQPQAEVELLHRGFYIAFITPSPGPQWDVWYNYLTETQGLSKKPAFIGMSMGGAHEYKWATANPDKVSCIYADNPGIYPADVLKLGGLIKHDVPLLNICGTLDFVLESNTKVIENIYHQAGGQISIMIKEGTGHHPHSLLDPKPIADFIEQHIQPNTTPRPDIVDDSFTKSYYYSTENSYIYLHKEDTYAACRGPQFTPCYDRYDKNLRSQFEVKGMTLLVPKKEAAGKPWVFRADRIGRDATALDLALLAKGFYIASAPVTGGGPAKKEWDAIYKDMTEHGFSKKPAMEGAGAGVGEAYAWAIENPDKVSCICGENPALRTIMSGRQEKKALVDDLAPLAKAGVPILHVCGSLDPWLERDTRVAEKKYKELGGNFTVILRPDEGHFPIGPVDPTPAVDFIVAKTQ